MLKHLALFPLICIAMLLTGSHADASYNAEAGRKYSVAVQRFADLKKTSKKNRYRSYWIDCVRSFEMIEKRYPKSPSAADACFARADVFQELYHHNKVSKDADEAIEDYAQCQTAHPKHKRAPEALYHAIVMHLDVKQERSAADDVYELLVKAYPDTIWTKKATERVGARKDKKRGKKETREAREKKEEPEIKTMPMPVISAPGKSGPDGVVNKIRFWSVGAYTRLVIDQTTPVRYHVQELKKPDRLVFDLFNARTGALLHREPIMINDGILKQVRVSQYAPDIVRIVLDLESIKSFTQFPLRDPDRLVIDVTGEGGGRKSSPSMTTAESASGAGREIVIAQRPEKSDSDRKGDGTLPLTPTISAAPASSIKPADDGKLSLSRQLGLKIQTIAIDAGHGGHDPGAIGKAGTREKNITLDVAKRLAALVKERLGCNIVMTRDSDVFIPLEERPFIAKSKGADLFVSVHVNATRKRKVRGIETYIQSLRASDRDAMATAARENAMSTKKLSELKSELDRIFADLAKDDKLEESLQLAHSVQTSMVESMAPVQGHVVNLGVKRAFFYVLINTEMPSILAEVGFISNPDEEKLLRTEEYRQSIAEALYLGVKKYVDARTPQTARL